MQILILVSSATDLAPIGSSKGEVATFISTSEPREIRSYPSQAVAREDRYPKMRPVLYPEEQAGADIKRKGDVAPFVKSEEWPELELAVGAGI
jgi:hypothetical protein